MKKGPPRVMMIAAICIDNDVLHVQTMLRAVAKGNESTTT